jgi:hypothetical protein
LFSAFFGLFYFLRISWPVPTVSSATMRRGDPIRAAVERLMAALDQAAAVQREIEAARAALDRAAARSALRVVRTGTTGESEVLPCPD